MCDVCNKNLAGKEEERAMFQQMQAMAQKQVSIEILIYSHTMRIKKNMMKVYDISGILFYFT